MRTIFFIPLFLLFLLGCEKKAVQQQEVTQTQIPETAASTELIEEVEPKIIIPTIIRNDTLAPFIPIGYNINEVTYGDLNKDELTDCIITIKKVDAANVIVNDYNWTVDRNRRGIIVLFKQAEGYNLASKNYDCFSSENEDGGVYFAPELWMESKNNNIRIHFSHGRYGYWTYTFRFNGFDFELIGYDASDNRGPVVNREVSINFLSKKKLVRVNINQQAESGEEVFEEKWEEIQPAETILLSEVVDFDVIDADQRE